MGFFFLLSFFSISYHHDKLVLQKCLSCLKSPFYFPVWKSEIMMDYKARRPGLKFSLF